MHMLPLFSSWATRIEPNAPCRVVVFVDEDNGDVDNIPSDGEGLDGNDETSDESEADSDVSQSFVFCVSMFE